MSLISAIFGGGPKPPDPVATAQSQEQINQQALIDAAKLNQINQVGPQGSITYSGAIGSPDRTQTTTLSPELQQLLNGQTSASNSLTDLANQRLAGAPQGDFQLGAKPWGYLGQGASEQLQRNVPTSTNFASNVQGGPIATGYDAGGNVQRGVNTDFSGQVQQAQDAAYARGAQYLDPQFEQSDQQLQSRLAAQGITQGSDAYNTEMANAARNKQSAYSDLRNNAIGQGDALQNQLFGQQLGAGQFSNSALAQQYGMNQGQAQFQNAAQSQNFGQGYQNAGLQNQAQNDTFAQNLSAADFNNQAMGQQFQQGLQVVNADNAMYQNNIQNDILARNQNINEAMAYMNGTPIAPQNPSYQPVAGSTAAQAAPDAVGTASANYSAGTQARSAILGSIFGAAGKIGGAAVAACWVAREVYGMGNPKWVKFREWMLGTAPKWLLKLYLVHGPKFALWIHDKPRVKAILRKWMDGRINAHA